MGYFDQFIQAPQLNEVLSGRTIVHIEVTPHFYTQLNNGYSSFNNIDLTNRRITCVFPEGPYIVIHLELEIYLCFSAYESLYHKSPETIPMVYGIKLSFDDRAYLTIHIPGIKGCLFVYDRHQYDKYLHNSEKEKLNAFDEEKFTFEKFKQYINRKSLSVCNAFINLTGVGYMPDVLYIAGINPKTRVDRLDDGELYVLYRSIKEINRQILEMHGEANEKDIYGCSGMYTKKMAGHLSHKPCPICGIKVEKHYTRTGMAVYYCPSCQPYKG